MKIDEFYEKYRNNNELLANNKTLFFLSLIFYIVFLIYFNFLNKFCNCVEVYLICYCCFIILGIGIGLIIKIYKLPTFKNINISDLIKKRPVSLDNNLKKTYNLLIESKIDNLKKFDELYRYINKEVSTKNKKLTFFHISKWFIPILTVFSPIIVAVISSDIKNTISIVIAILFIFLLLAVFDVMRYMIQNIYQSCFNELELKKELLKELEKLRIDFL